LPDSENESSTSGFASEHLSFLSLLITLIPSLSQTMASTKANDESLRRATDSDFETYASSAALGTKPTTLPTDQW